MIADPPRPLPPQIQGALRDVVEASGLEASDLMIVGAWCRDIWHQRLGHQFPTAATRDLDLAVAIPSWSAFQTVAASFDALGDTGIQFMINDVAVDVIPFGGIESPEGVVRPPHRGEDLSVWGFREVHAAAESILISAAGDLCLPSVPGYMALKLAAWLDRSAWYETKDASDIALALYWYAESDEINRRLYNAAPGQDILIEEQLDVECAAANLLGRDVTDLLGPDRSAELRQRWVQSTTIPLARELVIRGVPRSSPSNERRSELVDALTRGLWHPTQKIDE